MVFGPCGGVRDDGSCEMRTGPCTFTDVVEWLSPADRGPAPARPAPLVLTDLSVPPFDLRTLREVATDLAPTCDALLVGDHQDRVDAPAHLIARAIAESGSQPWVTLACRDRNRLVLEQELRTLALDALATVLCVTGDGRAYDVRPDVTQVFDLDGTRLAGLAAGLGVPAAVAETPTAPPRHLRPRRLVQKQRAGAGTAVLNHVSHVGEVAAFVDESRRCGLVMPVIASVVVYTDERSVGALNGLPGVHLDAADVATVLDAVDRTEAGIASAVRRAVELLALPGVSGVNLSGSASGGGARAAAAVHGEVGRRIRKAVAA